MNKRFINSFTAAGKPGFVFASISIYMIIRIFSKFQFSIPRDNVAFLMISGGTEISSFIQVHLKLEVKFGDNSLHWKSPQVGQN